MPQFSVAKGGMMPLKDAGFQTSLGLFKSIYMLTKSISWKQRFSGTISISQFCDPKMHAKVSKSALVYLTKKQNDNKENI